MKTRRKLCSECSQRPALFYQATSGRRIADADHDLCQQCYRAMMDRSREARRRPDVTVTVQCGEVAEEITFRAHTAWGGQNRQTLDLLHRVRTSRPA